MRPMKWPPANISLENFSDVLELADLGRMLRKHYWIVLAGLLLGALAGTALIYWRPDQYASRAQIRFIPPQVAERYVTPNLSMQVEQRVYALTQLLRSRLTATRLIESFGLYPERRRFLPVADVLPHFQDNLRIQTIGNEGDDKNTKVPTVEISFHYSDAETAQKVVQRLVELVFEENRRYRTEQSIGATEFLDEQAKRLTEEMEEVEIRLGELQNEMKSGNEGAGLGLDTQKMYAADSRLRDVMDQIHKQEFERRLRQGQMSAAEQRLRTIDTSPDNWRTLNVGVHSQLQQMRTRVAEARAVARTARERYQPNFPSRLRAEEDLREAEEEYERVEKMEVEYDRLRSREAVMAEMNKFRNEAKLAEQSIADLRNEESQLRAEIARMRAGLQVDPNTQIEFLRAKREYESLREQHAQLLKKQKESQQASEMEKRGQGETVELIEPASLAVSPEPPNRYFRWLALSFAGMLTGMLLASMLYLNRLKIQSRKHLEQWSGFTVLAQLPRTCLLFASGLDIALPPGQDGRWYRRAWQKLQDRPWPRPWRRLEAPQVSSSSGLLLLVLLGSLFLQGCSVLETPASLVKQAQDIEKKNPRGAAILYRKALQKDAKNGSAHRGLGLLFLAEGQWGAARESFIRAAESLPDDVGIRVKLADITYQLYFGDPGRPEAALREVDALADELIERWPKVSDGYRVKAQVLMERRKLPEALELLERAYTKFNQNEALVQQLASVEYQMGDFEQARQTLEDLIASRPEVNGAYDLLYLMAMEKGKLLLGEQTLQRKWASLQSTEAGLQLAAHYEAGGKKELFAQHWQQLEAKLDKSPLFHARAADFWMRRGEFARTKQHLEKGSQREPDQAVEYASREVELLLAQGKRKEAFALVQKEVKLRPYATTMQALHAALRLDAVAPGERSDATRKLESLLLQLPNSSFVRYHLGRAYMLSGEYQRAAEQLERSVTLDPNYAQGWLALAETQMLRGDLTSGSESVSRVLERAPGNPLARQLQARVMHLRGQTAEAERTLRDVAAEAAGQPGNLASGVLLDLLRTQMEMKKWADADRTLQSLRQREDLTPEQKTMANAQLLVAKGNAHGAITALRQGLQVDPQNVVLKFQLAGLLAKTNAHTEAAQLFRELVSLRPESTAYRLGLGDTLALAGKTAEALAEYKALQASAPNEAGPWLRAAALQKQLGDAKAAVESLRKATALAPGNAIALNNLAWLLLESGGDPNEALSLAQRARQMLPKSATVDDTLAAAYLKMGLRTNALAIYREMLHYLPEPEKAPVEKRIQELEGGARHGNKG